MDREILFRGFHKNERGADIAIIDGKPERGTWLYGDLVHRGGEVYVFPHDGRDSADRYKVDPSTVGQYTGKMVAERDATDDTACLHMKKVWQDDLIAIYSISYDDDDNPIRTHVATVQVKRDDDYQILFAKCVKGSMQKIAEECDISYLETDYDIPFTYFLETMENSACKFWEWEIIGNIHDGKEGAKQKEAGTDVYQQDD